MSLIDYIHLEDMVLSIQCAKCQEYFELKTINLEKAKFNRKPYLEIVVEPCSCKKKEDL